MPISGTQTVLAPIAPNNVNDSYSTHIDEYGRGGFRSVTTTASPGGTATNAQLGATIRLDRRKVGMLIYDTATSKYYRCTAVEIDGSYAVESFGAGTGSVTSVGLSMPGGFQVTNSPVTGSGTLTVATTLNGIVKGNGSAFEVATAGTDYAAATHTHTPAQIASITSGRLLGRYSSGAGTGEQIQVSTGLTLSAGGVLTAQGTGGTVTGITATTPIVATTTDSGVTYSLTHASSGVVAGTYGSASQVSRITVNATGHVTTVTSEPITGFLSTSGGTVSGDLTVTGTAALASLTLSGDLTVNGTTTTINSTTLSIDDKNVVLGDVATPSNTTADGGGITLKGASDKTLNWLNATGAWTSSEDFNLVATKAFRIAGTNVLTSNALGSGILTSSLTSVGTLSTGTWNATTIGLQYGGTGANLSAASDGAIFKKSGTALVAATAGTDYLNSSSDIDGGVY